MCSTLRMKVPDLSLTDSCTFMNSILSSGSSSLHPMSSMTSSSTSSSSQHHCKNWLSSGRLRVKQPLAINASPSQVYKYVLKYDIFYVFGLGQIYIFDLIWFDPWDQWGGLTKLKRPGGMNSLSWELNTHNPWSLNLDFNWGLF